MPKARDRGQFGDLLQGKGAPASIGVAITETNRVSETQGLNKKNSCKYFSKTS